MRKLPTVLKIYLPSIYVITALLVLVSYHIDYLPLNRQLDFTGYILFVILLALTESLTVYYKDISFSTSFAIQLASFILYGPAVTMIIIVLGFTFRIIKVGPGDYSHLLNTPIYGTIYNYCVLCLSILCGNFLYILLGGGTYFPIEKLHDNALQIAVFCGGVFIANTLIISTLYSLMNKRNFIYSFLTNVRLMVINILVISPFGVIISIIYERFQYWGVLLVFFPIVLARYTLSLYIDVKSQYFQTVDALMKSVEARDKYTEGHSQRVGEIATKIARILKYNDFKIEELKIASILHDVGKIGVDDAILNKPGMLTQEEYEKIKQHPEKGHEILKQVKNLEKIIPIVLHHHERYDGKGYPCGKKADELSLDVFIVQLADSIDAMATDRPYRKALSQELILQEVKKNSGTQFHPKVVEAYLKVVDKEGRIG